MSYFVPQRCVLQSVYCSVLPEHALPPCAGLGLVHERMCFCLPDPQDLEQPPDLDQPVHPPFTGQCLTKHFSVFDVEPEHLFPP